MNDREGGDTDGKLRDEIHILTFSLWGIRLAVDTDVVYKMISTNEENREEYEILNLHEKFKTGTGDYSYIYELPRVLLIQKNENELVGITVDKPEEIFAVEISAIKPLPRLIEVSVNPPMVWGVILQKSEIILLVDFYKIL